MSWNMCEMRQLEGPARLRKQRPGVPPLGSWLVKIRDGLWRRPLAQGLEEERSSDCPQSLVSLTMPCDPCSKLPSVLSSTKAWRERMMVTRLRLQKTLDNLRWWVSALQRQRVEKTWLCNQKDRFHSQLLLLSLQTNCLISPLPVPSSANWMTPGSTSQDCRVWYST